MRRVMIGTPTYDGRVDVRYVDSLVNTLRISGNTTILYPVFIPGDALIQRARNSLLKIAIESDVDDLVFIDSDIAWNPIDFMNILSHGVDMVSGLYRQKQDEEVLVIRKKESSIVRPDGLLEVNGVGCGFLRLTKTAMLKLWNASKPYVNGDNSSRAVFEVTIEGGEFCSEDIAMCHKWTAMGERVFVDTKIKCVHSGSKLYVLTLRTLPK